jgi:hypothetical protein
MAEEETIIRYAEPRSVGFIRAAVVGWWRYTHEIDPHDAGMVLWTAQQKKHGRVSIQLMLGLVALSPDVLAKFKPMNDGTLAAVTAVVQEHYKADFVRQRNH